jgi:hypothetical protein
MKTVSTYNKMVGCFLLMFLMILFSSCFRNFYSTNTKDPIKEPAVWADLKDQNKYYILHNSDKISALRNITITDSIMEADIYQIDEVNHLKYEIPDSGTNNEFKIKDKNYLLNEVHLYSKDSILKQTNKHISIHKSEISRIDLYKKNTKRSTTNYIISSLLLVFTFIVIPKILLSDLSFSPGRII